MSDNRAIFESPDKDQLARYADNLMHRANLVRTDGWDQYRHVWSCGEVIGTALILDDDAELQRCGETTISALERWAFDLWGNHRRPSRHRCRIAADASMVRLPPCRHPTRSEVKRWSLTVSEKPCSPQARSRSC